MMKAFLSLIVLCSPITAVLAQSRDSPYMRQVIVQVYGNPTFIRNDMDNILENFKTIYNVMVNETASEVCKKELFTITAINATDLGDLDSVSDPSPPLKDNSLLRPVVFNLGVSGRCLGCRYDRLFYDDEPYGNFEEVPDVCLPPNKRVFIRRFSEQLKPIEHDKEKTKFHDKLNQEKTQILDMDYLGKSCEKSTVQLFIAEVKVSFSTDEPNTDLTEDKEALADAFGRVYNLANHYSAATNAFPANLCDQRCRHIPQGEVTVTSEEQTAAARFTIKGRCRGCCARGSGSLFFGKGDGGSTNEIGNMEVVGNTDPAAERALTAEVGEISEDRSFDCFCAARKQKKEKKKQKKKRGKDSPPAKWDRPPTSGEFVEAFKERIGDLRSAKLLKRVKGVKKASMVRFSCYNDDSTGMDRTGMDRTDVEEEL